MPLNRRLRKVKRNMEQEYGKEKGEKVFFAWENKQRKLRRRKRA